MNWETVTICLGMLVGWHLGADIIDSILEHFREKRRRNREQSD